MDDRRIMISEFIIDEIHMIKVAKYYFWSVIEQSYNNKTILSK
jgi:hypothetical protein